MSKTEDGEKLARKVLLEQFEHLFKFCIVYEIELDKYQYSESKIKEMIDEDL